MCLAVPGKILEINDVHGLRMGRVDFAGLVKQVCLATVPDAEPGRYVLVHAGFALNVLDEEEAEASLSLWRELEEAAAEEGTDVFGMPLDPAPEERGP